jgi:hypothetical protein
LPFFIHHSSLITHHPLYEWAGFGLQNGYWYL